MQWRLSKLAPGLMAVLLPLSLHACNDASFSGSTATAKPTPKPTPTLAPTPAPVVYQPAPTPAPVPTPAAPAAPANAITQGSFTVWAQPPNPAPAQDYQIFILVRLPQAMPNYTLADLSGNLVGTDGYTQTIPMSFKSGDIQLQGMTPQFAVNGTTAELAVWVPGAASHVQDTVQLHSALLNESQNIQINFQ